MLCCMQCYTLCRIPCYMLCYMLCHMLCYVLCSMPCRMLTRYMLRAICYMLCYMQCFTLCHMRCDVLSYMLCHMLCYMLHDTLCYMLYACYTICHAICHAICYTPCYMLHAMLYAICIPFPYPRPAGTPGELGPPPFSSGYRWLPLPWLCVAALLAPPRRRADFHAYSNEFGTPGRHDPAAAHTQSTGWQGAGSAASVVGVHLFLESLRLRAANEYFAACHRCGGRWQPVLHGLPPLSACCCNVICHAICDAIHCDTYCALRYAL